jgi:putative transposase
MVFPVYHPEFVTVTCLEWKFLLREDAHKDILIDSFRFMVRKKRLIILGFTLMDNHFHAIRQPTGEHQPADIQRDMLKYTGQKILNKMILEGSPVVPELLVNAKDRKYQFWERNSLRVPLWSDRVFNQKLDYIHMNPVRAGLCASPEDYKYSSARYYLLNEDTWDFLTPACW